MDQSFHSLSELFAQLGLPNSAAEIDAFVQRHGRLPSHITLIEADFWSGAQADFLRESLAEDADWAEAVDHLDALLR